MSFLKKNIISLVALIVSVVSCIFTYQQCSLAQKQARLHLEPKIKSYIDFPEKELPFIVVGNIGNIPAVSLSIEHNMFVFKKSSKKIEIAVKSSSMLSPGPIFVESFRPAEKKKIELPIIENYINRIVVYELCLKYFRESDMKEFNKTDYYFDDDGQHYTHTEFRKNKFYKDVMVGIGDTNIAMNKTIHNLKLLPGALKNFETNASKK